MKTILFIIFLFICSNIIIAQNSSLSYQYDSLNRLTRVEYENGTVIEFTYDAVGNRETHVVTVEVAVFTDTEPVASTGTYHFNESGEGGDGHDVDMVFESITGSGDITVEQTNQRPQNLSSNNGLAITWDITNDPAITAFTTDVTFHYLESDLNGIDENSLVPAYYDNAQSAWITLSDFTRDVSNNTVTVNDLDHFTEFALGLKDAFGLHDVYAKIKAYLEGPFEADTMQTTLKKDQVIPLDQPFNVAPWNYNGTESVAAIPDSVVDWVLVELRTAPEAASKVASRAVFLNSIGSIVDTSGSFPFKFADINYGDYFVVIKHRNHLAIMSADRHRFDGSSSLYDFSSGLDKTYGANAMVDLGNGILGMFTGDANGNGQIQNDDKNDYWKNQVGLAGYQSADFNLNGQVQNDDKNDYWKLNVGLGSQFEVFESTESTIIISTKEEQKKRLKKIIRDSQVFNTKSEKAVGGIK